MNHAASHNNNGLDQQVTYLIDTLVQLDLQSKYPYRVKP